MGFTCGACHTGQLNYNGTGIRMDGGQAGTDMDSCLHALSAAVSAARDSPRFVKKVMDRGNYSSGDDVIEDVKKYGQRLSLYNVVNHSEIPYGCSRLDAFGRIFNRVLEHIITQEELKELLNTVAGDLVREGKLTQAEVDSIQQQQKSDILSSNQRDHLILRLSQALPLKPQLSMIMQTFTRPAP